MSSNFFTKKYTVINISGKLDKYLGEELIEQIDEIVHLSPVILVDLSALESIDLDGISCLQQFGELIKNQNNTNFIAIASKNDKIKEELENLKLPPEVRVFNDKSVAKEFLEKQYNASVKAENKPLPNQIEVPIDKTRELPSQSPAKELFYINCPNCSVKLRAYAEGNHACPKCKTRFFVHSDKTISLFESISLQ